MYIKDLLSKKRPTVSLELFPPKKGDTQEKSYEVISKSVALKPDFISVTYGAGGSNNKNTLEMADYIIKEGAVPLVHLTCVGVNEEMIISELTQQKKIGVKNILALRGDLKDGIPIPEDAKFRFASDLVEEILDFGGFCVGGACYAEGHIESANLDEDIENLKKKVDAGCSFLTTQMFFDNSVLYKFLYKIREAGITIPVLAGIMPVTNGKQIKRILELSGASLPPRFKNIVDKFGHDRNAMEQAGVAYATEQIIDLIANGVNGVHIYTMNKPDIAEGILNNLSYIIEV